MIDIYVISISNQRDSAALQRARSVLTLSQSSREVYVQRLNAIVEAEMWNAIEVEWGCF